MPHPETERYLEAVADHTSQLVADVIVLRMLTKAAIAVLDAWDASADELGYSDRLAVRITQLRELVERVGET